MGFDVSNADTPNEVEISGHEVSLNEANNVSDSRAAFEALLGGPNGNITTTPTTKRRGRPKKKKVF